MVAQAEEEVIDAGNAGIGVFGFHDPFGEVELGGVGLFEEEGFDVGLIVEEPFQFFGEGDDTWIGVGFQFHGNGVAVVFADGYADVHGHRQTVHTIPFGHQTFSDKLAIDPGFDFDFSGRSEFCGRIKGEVDIDQLVVIPVHFPRK